jgi:hypothetical protein
MTCNSFFYFSLKVISIFRAVSKRSNQLNLRLTEEEAAFYAALAEESGLALSEIIRRLMRAARECFDANDGWPREIAVVKKGRAGGAPAPIATTSTSSTYEDQTRSLSPANAYAAPEAPTKGTPRPHPTTRK